MSDEKRDERERTFRAYNMDIEAETAGDYGIPILEPCDAKPKDLLAFNYVMSQKFATDAGIHFFIDDYQFERVWNQPEKYMEKLRPYPCVFTPDFSLYTDMDLPVQIWNTYRSRLIGAYWQSKGLNVVPTLQWSTARSFDFVFDGLPKNSTVAVSAIGANSDWYSRFLWKYGMAEAIRRLEPARILVYGEIPGYTFPEEIEVIRYGSFCQAVRSRTEGR